MNKWLLYRDRLAQWLIYLAVLAVSAVFVWILIDLARGGITHLSWDFLTESPRDAGLSGGLGSFLFSTLWLLLLALFAVLPLAWTTALLLAEFVPVVSGFGMVIGLACRCWLVCHRLFSGYLVM